MNYCVSNDVNFVLIPKNASSWIKETIKNKTYSNSPTGQLHAVILRDPIDRWVSGVVQFLMSQHAKNYNFTTEDVLDVFFTQNSVLDPHTYPQSSFVDDLDKNKIIWFRFENYLTKNIHEFCTKKNIDTKTVSIINSSNTNKNKTELMQEYKRITNSPQYKTALQDLYKSDYDLINSVTFYNQ